MRHLYSLAALPLLQSAAMFAISGMGFVVATLAFGHFLDTATFGQCVLMLALCLSAVQAAPAGINALVVRRDLRSDAGILMLGAIVAALFAVLAVVAGSLIYDLPAFDLAVLAFAVMAGGTAVTAKSALQRKQQYKRATLLWQSANAGLLLAVCLMALGVGLNQWMPVLMAGLALLVTGAVAWADVLRSPVQGKPLTARLWPQGLNLGGLGVSAEVFAQIERFLLPLLLAYEELALFALASALVLTPFRMLEMGAVSTLAPRLRRAAPDRRVHMLLVDVALLAVLCAMAGVVLISVGPWLYSLVVSGGALAVGTIVAIIVSGFVRVLVALAQGVAVAFGTGQDLGRVHLVSWLSVAIAICGALLLADGGLEGVVYGVAFGWLFKAGVTFGITMRHLRIEVIAEPPKPSTAS